jgi:hypothetical protein
MKLGKRGRSHLGFWDGTTPPCDDEAVARMGHPAAPFGRRCV